MGRIPSIAAGDELPLIHEISGDHAAHAGKPLGYPEALAELWMGDQREGLDNLRDYYLQKVRQMGVLREVATRFTDKMPLNETHLGLIALLFPEAPLIHVLRHPLDIMVSAFSNQFTHGFFCGDHLVTAAQHYVRVMELVQHYRAEMTLRYLPIRYEDIVADQQASVRAMLAFVGEDFDTACLTFHQNRRYARTASYAQVTEPLYATFGVSLSPLPQAPGTGIADIAAGDRASRLHGGLMETPGPAPRAPASGTVTLPVGEVLRIANEYEHGGRADYAKRLLDHILDASPNQGDTLHLAGIVAFRKGDIAKSLELRERSLTYGIDTPLYLRNICEVYRRWAAWTRPSIRAPRHGTGAVRSAVPAQPGGHPLSPAGTGRRTELRQPRAPHRSRHARRTFRRAEALLCAANGRRAGRNTNGAFVSPALLRSCHPPGRPQWDGGASADETLLLIADQGFGDVIQFARYIPWAAKRCRDIAIASSVEVRPLLQQIAPAARQFVRGEDAPDYAAYCPLSGLPRLAGTRIDSVTGADTLSACRPGTHRAGAGAAGRLDTPAACAASAWIWAGRPTHNNDRNRSALLADFRPLASVSGVALLALQKGPKTDQAGAYYGRAPLINIGAEIEDYDDTMAILDNLDLLVTVDTSARIWRAPWRGRCGSCYRARPIGAGCSIALKRRGIRPYGCSVRPRCAGGTMSRRRSRPGWPHTTGITRGSAGVGDGPDLVRVAADLAQHFLGMLAERRP